MAQQAKTAPKKPIIYLIIKILTVVALIVYIGFLTATIVNESLGGMLLFIPAVLSGILLCLLLFIWPGKWSSKLKNGLMIGFMVAFAITGYYSFHVMFKFIQPTVLPKSAVNIGAPWVKGNNIFTDNNWNNMVVIKLSDNNYRMYFHDSDNMKMAKSTDGQHFDEPTMLFKGEMPTVIQLPDGQWRMYYFVNADQPAQQQNQPPGPGQQPPPMQCNSDACPPPKHKLVSAVSTDGDTWTPEPGVRLEAANTGYERDTMIHPTVIRIGDGSYKLYYDGEVVPTSPLALAVHYRKILSASSKDGLTWTRDPGYRIDEKPVHTWEAYSPKALYENGKVVLHFTTPNGIYEATSTDTLNFTVSKNPVFTPGRIPMPGDIGAMDSYQDAYVLPDGSVNRIYFWINGQGIFYASQQR